MRTAVRAIFGLLLVRQWVLPPRVNRDTPTPPGCLAPVSRGASGVSVVELPVIGVAMKSQAGQFFVTSCT